MTNASQDDAAAEEPRAAPARGSTDPVADSTAAPARAPLDPSELPALNVSTEKVCFLVINQRRYAVKDVDTELDSGSNAVDEGMIDVLEDSPDDPVLRELVSFIQSLNIDEQLDLVTLAWVGRGDGGIEDWHRLRALAGQERNTRVATYLLGLPLLADYLEEGLALFGGSCAEFESLRPG
jgi:hypothetical protein